MRQPTGILSLLKVYNVYRNEREENFRQNVNQLKVPQMRWLFAEFMYPSIARHAVIHLGAEKKYVCQGQNGSSIQSDSPLKNSTLFI